MNSPICFIKHYNGISYLLLKISSFCIGEGVSLEAIPPFKVVPLVVRSRPQDA